MCSECRAVLSAERRGSLGDGPWQSLKADFGSQVVSEQTLFMQELGKSSRCIYDWNEWQKSSLEDGSKGRDLFGNFFLLKRKYMCLLLKL